MKIVIKLLALDFPIYILQINIEWGFQNQKMFCSCFDHDTQRPLWRIVAVWTAELYRLYLNLLLWVWTYEQYKTAFRSVFGLFSNYTHETKLCYIFSIAFLYLNIKLVAILRMIEGRSAAQKNYLAFGAIAWNRIPSNIVLCLKYAAFFHSIELNGYFCHNFNQEA